MFKLLTAFAVALGVLTSVTVSVSAFNGIVKSNELSAQQGKQATHTEPDRQVKKAKKGKKARKPETAAPPPEGEKK